MANCCCVYAGAVGYVRCAISQGRQVFSYLFHRRLFIGIDQWTCRKRVHQYSASLFQQIDSSTTRGEEEDDEKKSKSIRMQKISRSKSSFVQQTLIWTSVDRKNCLCWWKFLLKLDHRISWDMKFWYFVRGSPPPHPPAKLLELDGRGRLTLQTELQMRISSELVLKNQAPDLFFRSGLKSG